jgi:FKBP-type peptidyl-prolyl cis-trans isomerase (trigger factor)
LRPSPAARKGLCVRAEAARAQAGDFVAVDYTGTLDDGSVFDTSRKEGRTPLEFQIGGGMVRHAAPLLGTAASFPKAAVRGQG